MGRSRGPTASRRGGVREERSQRLRSGRGQFGAWRRRQRRRCHSNSLVSGHVATDVCPRQPTAASHKLAAAWAGSRTKKHIGTTLQLWFLGQLADMIIVTILVGAGLFLLGVPLAMTLAIFAGLLNFVPYVGALAGAVPAILVAFSQSPTLALWVTLVFVGVQMLEGSVIAPLIQRRTISLPPALTILSQTILGTLFGAFELILATPLVAALLTAVRMIYIEGVVEDTSSPEVERQP